MDRITDTRIDSEQTDRGAGLAEYALLMLLIVLACIIALTTLGTTISGYITTAIGMF